MEYERRLRTPIFPSPIRYHPGVPQSSPIPNSSVDLYPLVTKIIPMVHPCGRGVAVGVGSPSVEALDQGGCPLWEGAVKNVSGFHPYWTGGGVGVGGRTPIFPVPMRPQTWC